MEIRKRMGWVITDGVGQSRLLILETRRSSDLLGCVLPAEILNSLADALHGPVNSARILDSVPDIIPELLQGTRKSLLSQRAPAGK